jgi:hypothetical protein
MGDKPATKLGNKFSLLIQSKGASGSTAAPGCGMSESRVHALCGDEVEFTPTDLASIDTWAGGKGWRGE